MRAVTYQRFGGPEVLALQDCPRPMPGPGEIGVDVTVVVSFEVTPERQQALADDIRAFNLDYVRHQPGFVATNLYLSHDGTRVVNLGQWRDEATYRQFLAGPLRVRAPKSFAEFPFDSRPYTLAFRVTPAGPAEDKPASPR